MMEKPMGTRSLYDALVEKSAQAQLRAIPAPYDKCLYEILYPDKPWPPKDAD